LLQYYCGHPYLPLNFHPSPPGLTDCFFPQPRPPFPSLMLHLTPSQILPMCSFNRSDPVPLTFVKSFSRRAVTTWFFLLSLPPVGVPCTSFILPVKLDLVFRYLCEDNVGCFPNMSFLPVVFRLFLFFGESVVPSWKDPKVFTFLLRTRRRIVGLNSPPYSFCRAYLEFFFLVFMCEGLLEGLPPSLSSIPSILFKYDVLRRGRP